MTMDFVINVTNCNNITKNPKVFIKYAVKHVTKEKCKKEYWKMTDGIGRIFGGNNYGVGGYVPRRNEEEAPQNGTAQAPVNNYEETQVDPSKVMDFLASNNFFMAPVESAPVAGEVDEATRNRVEGYMENFEMIYGVIVEEFGEELAPAVMDIAMDYLMGMAA